MMQANHKGKILAMLTPKAIAIIHIVTSPIALNIFLILYNSSIP